MDAQAIADKLTKAQREAIIQCVDALNDLAGEGFCVAEDAIFELHNAFYGNGEHYGEWIRALLENHDGR